MGDSLASKNSVHLGPNAVIQGATQVSFLFRSFFNLSVPMSVVGNPLANESPLSRHDGYYK
jgi:hypothetical protein